MTFDKEITVMKLKLTLVLLLLIALIPVSGCSKKEEPVASSPQDAEQKADGLRQGRR